MKDFQNKYFEIAKIIELPCLNFSAYEAVRLLEDSIFLGDAKLHHSALEKLAEIIKRDESMGGYYSSELIKLAIESKNESILEATVITFEEKLANYHVSKIIKQTMELNDDKVFEFVWDKLANNFNLDSSYYANKLMEELIDAKNTKLLNLVTNKLTDIIRSNASLGNYYLNKLLEKAIASQEPQITKFITSIVVGKISKLYGNEIIKYAIDINDGALLEQIISTCGETLHNLDIKMIVEHAIASGDENRLDSLLPTYGKKLNNSVFLDILEDSIKAKNIELIKYILKFIDCDKFHYFQRAITHTIEINEYQIFDLLWEKFSDKIKYPIDISNLIDTAIKSDNIEFFNIIWGKFSEKNVYGFKIIVSALKSKNEFKIDTVLKKYLTYHYSDSEIKYLLKNLSQSPQNIISKEIKILFSKLLLKMKTVDFENLSHFSQDETLYEKDEDGLPLLYHLFQKEVDIPARELLDSIDINKYLPEGINIFSRSSSYKHYISKEANCNR